ncbi:MAG: hypothetical protein OEZ48_08740 [Candidatus Bathyarchaeota archaeon]|nr:hypothetical protein [Candidatus Bathyarchaeota archaeon]
MRASELTSGFVQLVLIFLLIGGGVYALSKYPAGMFVLAFLCNLYNGFVTSNQIPFFSSYLLEPQTAVTILTVLLCFWGVRSILIKGGDGKGFVSLTGFLVYPSVLCYSFIGWSAWSSYLLGMSLDFFQTELTFYECTLLMVFIVVALLSFRFISTFREDKRDLLTRGGEAKDVERVFTRAHIYMSLAMSGILFILAVLMFPLAIINALVYYLIESIPLGLMVLGIAFSVLILVSVYFFIKKATVRSP